MSATEPSLPIPGAPSTVIAVSSILPEMTWLFLGGFIDDSIPSFMVVVGEAAATQNEACLRQHDRSMSFRQGEDSVVECDNMLSFLPVRYLEKRRRREVGPKQQNNVFLRQSQSGTGIFHFCVTSRCAVRKSVEGGVTETEECPDVEAFL